ncbi:MULTISPECIES: c-type cytochrome [Halocynthiibacter]|uniref:Cytochrome c family protein n=1 Tax=Halocynthiibacter halioticoli TaxID=2986804 RepID=A0AAE3LQC1_9RHOB|nr:MULTISPECIES: cytochrome c family protein [Halocynthiibacter]MCV6823333.1 cytochrome c family protein [Halocynthiibacter halioticoli]MCW4056334.1 cytochrome c family protein [Halocynthiibacter sp. SDUM655004]MDE0590700.1 cytochrome c family protein [Halocynthiibacter sp. C4]
MFDTMTMTKILGAFCGALLFFLLGSWAAEALYHTGGGHGDDHAAQGYLIETGGSDVAEVADDGPTFEELLATADAGKGEKVFGKCKACHKIEDGANGTGPHLYGAVDRDIASVAGFSYSDVLTGMEGNWTPEALDGFLENPKGYAPGTKMGFSGLKKAQDRANLIAYMQTIGG